MGTLLQEIRRAARALSRTPAFSLPVILTLTLGLSGVVLVFSLITSILLRPLPYHESERLIRLYSAVPNVGAAEYWGVARPQFLHLREAARSFERLALYSIVPATVGTDEPGTAAEMLTVAYVDLGIYDVLRTHVAAGRPPTREDELFEKPRAAWLTDRFWTARWGRDPSVIGRTILVDGRPVEIAGILASNATLPEELEVPDIVRVDLWLPIWLDPAQPPVPGGHTLRAIGRLASGVTPEAADRELLELSRRLPETVPGAYTPEFMRQTGFRMRAIPLRDDVIGDVRPVLWVLFSFVVLLLLSCVANIGSLFLARAEVRRRDVAVRLALGAERWALVRFFLAETLLLTLVSGALALLMARLGIRALAASSLPIPRAPELGIGWEAVAFTALLCAGIALFFGVHSLHRSGQRTIQVLLGTRTGATRVRTRVRSVLVGVQVALSVVLLAGAVLLGRSYRNLRAVDPGFDPTGVVTFRVVLPESRYADFPSVERFYTAFSERLGAIPGVQATGITTALPLSGFDGCSSVDVRGASALDGRPLCVPAHLAAPGYFAALGIPVRGKAPDWGEVADGTAGVVVSEAFARRVWPDGDALGQALRIGTRGDFAIIVGVARDVRAGGLDRPPTEDVYLPLLPRFAEALGGPPRHMVFLVRTNLQAPERLSPAFRAALAEVDPQVAITDVQLMDQIVARSMIRVSFSSLLLMMASAIALFLSGVGIYGLVSYLATQRRGELGIRAALGGTPDRLRWLIVGQSLRVAIVAAVFGLLGARLVAALLESMLYGARGAEALLLLAVAGLVLLITGAAGLAPAQRAVRADPMEALRSE
ncbi:MAG TPA: ADOP family duplicated permease [Longimicrobiales bacterium]